jgi:hypothetical protein
VGGGREARVQPAQNARPSEDVFNDGHPQVAEGTGVSGHHKHLVADLSHSLDYDLDQRPSPQFQEGLVLSHPAAAAAGKDKA